MQRKLLPLLFAVCLAGAGPGMASGATFASAHFRFTYDESRLPRAGADAAARDAEQAYEYNQQRFPGAGPPEIRCDLTPRFMGATGYAQPDRRPPVIAVRIPDLDYLGLDESYVLRHEIAHVFSGRLASGPMGEGLADYIAGGFGDMALAPWWGSALRDAGLWVDPEALFVTGDYPASTELDARQRVANYTEPALLLQFLTERFGFERVLDFLPDYGRARRSLESNEAGARRRGFRPPDVAAVRTAFDRHFGRSWAALQGDWERQMGVTKGTDLARRQLVIRQETYAAIRNFEMWVLAQRGRVGPERISPVRRAFTAVNAAVRAQHLDEAEARLRLAEGLVNDLKRPALVARASFRLAPASNLG
jgi:hypothetical protein